MKIALIAHDKKKEDMIQFVTAYKAFFNNMTYLQLEQQGHELWSDVYYRYIVSFWSSWRRPRNRGNDCTR